MRCFINTNILVSASLFPDSVPAQAFEKAAAHHNTAIVCDYAIDELRRVYNKKFPHKIGALESLLSTLLLSTVIVSTPPAHEKHTGEEKIRDINDRPIFRAAIKAKSDVIITGDKDFLESGILSPKIMIPAQFIANG